VRNMLQISDANHRTGATGKATQRLWRLVSRAGRPISKTIGQMVARNRKAGSLHPEKRRLPGARSAKRAGSAVELRPAPKARNAAHPQERQHSAAAGGTRDRVRPAGALRARRLRRPASGIVTRMGGDARALDDNGSSWLSGSGRNAPRARPEGDAPGNVH
jgi:hypothetical protein